MPRQKKIPAYTKHKASGQAVVRIDGIDHYLGPHGTKASHDEYDRVIAEWLARGRQPEVSNRELSVVELCSRYLDHATQYYQKNGRCTGSVPKIKVCIRHLREWYGRENADLFGPLKLKAVRDRMIREGQSRRYINDLMDWIKRMFKWAVSEELLPVSVYEALRTVPGLQAGRSAVREKEPVKPVEDVVVEQTMPHLPGIVGEMVKFQRLTGCRPQDVCNLRPCNVDRGKDIWRYMPETHKTEHHGRHRVVMIGPRTQEILQPFLNREPEMHCFRPVDSETKRRVQATAQRKTPINWGNKVGSNRKSKPQRQPGTSYSTTEYRKAIWRACEKAWPVPEGVARRKGETDKEWRERLGEDWEKVLDWRRQHRWSPNQLRHAAATEVRQHHGLEAAQVYLGHSKADTTQIYAERDISLAEKVARERG